MKRTGRAKLYCKKRIGRNVWDCFTVSVAAGKKDAAEAEYKRQGYQVVTL